MINEEKRIMSENMTVKEASEFWDTHSKGVIGNCSKKSEAGGFGGTGNGHFVTP